VLADLLKRTRKALMYGLDTIDIPIDEDVMKFFLMEIEVYFYGSKKRGGCLFDKSKDVNQRLRTF